jgi:hypothetical protein
MATPRNRRVHREAEAVIGAAVPRHADDVSDQLVKQRLRSLCQSDAVGIWRGCAFTIDLTMLPPPMPAGKRAVIEG